MTELKATIISTTLLVAFALSFLDASAAGAADRHVEIGKGFLVNQNFDMAIKEFNEALKRNPKSAEALIERGTAYNGLGKYELAMKDFDAAMKIAPNNYLVYNNRGVTYFRLGQFAQSIKDLDKAISLDSTQPIPYLNRAGASLLNGSGASSADQIAAFLTRSNWKGDYAGHSAILGALGYRQGNNPAAAQALLEAAMAKTDRLKWPYPALKYLLGKIKGKELLEEAERSDYDSTQAHCFVALDFILKGDQKLAQNHIEWVTKNGIRNSVEYWIARGLTKPSNVQAVTGNVKRDSKN